MTGAILPGRCVSSILGELGPLGPEHVETGPKRPPGPLPFVTISREVGAGGLTLGREVVEAMNRIEGCEARGADAPRWTCWDRELVDKIAADHHLSTSLIDRLEEGRHTSLAEIVGGLIVGPAGGYVDEGIVYARLVRTVRALALAGRTVLVGRGAVFVTRRLGGGIHLRLVAPRPWRIAFMARELKCSDREATAWVDRAERQRHAFIHRHWPGETMGPETFTLTFNCEEVTTPQMADTVCRLAAVRLGVAV